MDIHKNARSCPASRLLLVNRIRSGVSAESAAEAAGISRRTAYKWLARHRLEGEAGLTDRSSRPLGMPRKIGQGVVEEILRLRRKRYTCRELARRLGLSRATIARLVGQAGLARLRMLDGREPVRRYQRERPGDLLHFDIKKLARIRGVGHRITGDLSRRARGVGWEFVHVCIDDASRLAYAEILSNERAEQAAAFLSRAVCWFASHRIGARSVMTDNGPCYVSRSFAAACQSLKLRHIRTRPYRPRTNGKAERFIQTLLREWAYRRPYHSSYQRNARLPRYLRYYNQRRPHAALNQKAPASLLPSSE